MTVPSREQAVAVLLDLRPAAGLMRHMMVVAEIAAELGARLAVRGVPIDRHTVEAAALLHDLDKALPATDPVRVLGHGYAGAEWLQRRGMEELSSAVAWHPVSRLGPDELYQQFLSEASWEARVVAYADKRSTQRVVSIDARFLRWERRHPDLEASLERAKERALALEAEICAAAGIGPSGVRRRRWVRAVLARDAAWAS